MDKLTSFVDFVKSQAAFHWRQVERFPTDARRQELHTATAKNFDELAQALMELVEARNGGQEESWVGVSSARKRLALTWEEVVDLPRELMAELSVSDADKAEFSIIAIINDAGGVASLDRVLVALYRQSGEITKRQALNSRLYRMAQKLLLFSVPGKKGVYATRPITEDEAEDLI